MEQHLIKFLTVLESMIPAGSSLLETSTAYPHLNQRPPVASKASHAPVSQPGDNPGAVQIMKHLHTVRQMSHNEGLKEVNDMLFNDLRATRGAIILVVNPTGAAAIEWDGHQFKAFASNGGPVQSSSSYVGGEIKQFIKSVIGSIRDTMGGKYYFGTRNFYAKNTSTQRSTDEKNRNVPMSTDAIMAKFRPTWLRYLEWAKSDVEQVATSFIKSGAYPRAKKKLEKLVEIDTAITSLLSQGNTSIINKLKVYMPHTPTQFQNPQIIKNALTQALELAAIHYFPDMEAHKALDQYMLALSGGDKQSKSVNNVKMMHTALKFFKGELVK